MSILCWEKPIKINSAEEQARNYGFDGGPVGGYIPNMSQEDAEKWKAKITGIKKGFPQVEIRKSFPQAQIVMIVSLGDGYSYKHNVPEYTKGINIHFACNGGLQMTFEQMTELNQAIEEAKQVLHNLQD